MPSLQTLDLPSASTCLPVGVSSALEQFSKVVTSSFAELQTSLLREYEVRQVHVQEQMRETEEFQVNPSQPELRLMESNTSQFYSMGSYASAGMTEVMAASYSLNSAFTDTSDAKPCILTGAEANWADLVVQVLEANTVFGNFTVHPQWKAEVLLMQSMSKTTVSRASFSPGTAHLWSPTYRSTSRSHMGDSSGPKDIDRLKRRLTHLEHKAYYKGGSSSLLEDDSWCWRPTLIAHPYSPRRFVWGCLSLLLIIADFIVVTTMPFALDSSTLYWKVIDWAIALFWTLDIFWNFTTGYFHQGRLEMQFRAIALHYTRRWFAFDVFIVFLSWLVVVSQGANVRTFVTTARLGRLLRVLTLKVVLNSKVSTRFRKPLRNSTFVISLIVFIHVCGCLWYYVGKTENGWVANILLIRPEEGSGAFHAYLQSVRWAMAQLQGNMELEIQYTVKETMFEIVVNFCSILVMATFVSSLTNALASFLRHRKRSKGVKRAAWAYLRRHKISYELSEKVKMCILKQMLDQARQKFQEEDAKDKIALDALPVQLRRQLLTEARARPLDWHPMFAFLKISDARLLEKVCCDAVSQVTFEDNENVFYTGDSCLNAYWVVAGSFSLVNVIPITANMIGKELCSLLLLQKRPAGTESCNTDDTRKDSACTGSTTSNLTSACATLFPISDDISVTSATVVSEASLWMACHHCSTLNCSGRGVLFIVNAGDFIKIVRSDPLFVGAFVWYANRFVKAATLAMHSTEAPFQPDLFNFRSVMVEERREVKRQHSVVPSFSSECTACAHESKVTL